MEIYTIGFAKKSAEQFFEAIRREQIQQLVDVRIHNSSQLAGFTKSGDLPYFLDRLCDASYRHEPLLAPTAELLSSYRSKQIKWEQYEVEFLRLLESRHVESVMSREEFEKKSILLCSEATASKCHRRLVVEYLARFWPDVTAKHL
jgi:uncharacterized protein (DUF488 family)